MMGWLNSRDRRIVGVAICIGFIPAALFSSYNMYICYLALCLCFATITLECIVLVESHMQKSTGDTLGSLLMWLENTIELVKILGTTLAPLGMLIAGGGSFAFLVKLQQSADSCNVGTLAELGRSGYVSFFCTDGFVASEMQHGVAAWNISAGGAGLIPAMGYTAPLFASRSAFEQGNAPVAWAVKAGQPVSPNECDRHPQGTCGFFVQPLRKAWQEFQAPMGFGESWGFNITQFSDEEMRASVAMVMIKSPRANWGALAGTADMPFVITEDFGDYFGHAVIYMWVSVALAIIGLIDRLLVLRRSPAMRSDSRTLVDDSAWCGHDGGNVVHCVEEAAVEMEEERSFRQELVAMWANPLNSPREDENGGPSLYAPSPNSRPPFRDPFQTNPAYLRLVN